MKPAWIPFALFCAFLASGFVVFRRPPEVSALPPPSDDRACPEETGAPPLPAAADLRVLEDELHRAIALSLGSDLALGASQEVAVRAAIRDGLASVQAIWASGDRATADESLEPVYARTRAALQSLLTDAQWQRLQSQGPFTPRRN